MNEECFAKQPFNELFTVSWRTYLWRHHLRQRVTFRHDRSLLLVSSTGLTGRILLHVYKKKQLITLAGAFMSDSNDAPYDFKNSSPFPDIPKELYQRKPKQPEPSDCCGNGCTLCVNDIYEQELKIWENECANYLAGKLDDGEVVYVIIFPCFFVFERMDCLQSFYNSAVTSNYYVLQSTSLSQHAYTNLQVTEVTRVTERCTLYTFKVHHHDTQRLKVGHHLIMR